eukprot:s228_g54.t1
MLLSLICTVKKSAKVATLRPAVSLILNLIGHMQLCPELHVEDKSFQAEVLARDGRSVAAVSDCRRKGEAARIDTGIASCLSPPVQVRFAALSPAQLSWTAPVGRLALGVLQLEQHGWPATFIALYDEAWAMARDAGAVMREATGNSLCMDVVGFLVRPSQTKGFSPHRDRTEAAASASAASASTSAPEADQIMPLTGWQRQVALQIIEQLHLTCPVYMRAPSLAEIWSWNAVTVSLTPEAHEHTRVGATDVGGHLWETWKTDAEHADMEAPDSDPSHSDPDPVVDPGSGSAGTAGTAGTMGDAAPGDLTGAPPTRAQGHKGDPAHVPRGPHQAAAQALRGLHIFCWNSGGLGGGLYPELLTFLTESATDVAIILETKWQENMEFTTGPWTCVHGGCKSRKEAGILILVRQSLAPASQLRYEHLLQGRVAHVRIPLRGSEARHLHIIAVYQKVHNPKVASCMDQRQQVWQAVHRCLHGLPVRDSILLLGDFNTPVQTELPYVGHHVSPLPSHPPEDMEKLKLLMRAHALVAINTWRSNAAPAATFKWGKAETQIDFLMVRQRDASVQAKKAAALRTFHVGASRHTGAIHFPVLAYGPRGTPASHGSPPAAC